MTNKTFKEEVMDKMSIMVNDIEFDAPLSVTDYAKLGRFIESSLDLYKQKILEAFPEIPRDAEKWSYTHGVADTLVQFKQIIENI